ncbi:MAG: 3-phosphoshikimate 1-carboxyvinyltransferase [Flexistipes sinusarabici]|uniref:3-phosphoshikimate 1-carboxyvinyltransferase n=1 Tax=Flexistipes sinusarabici TaxID=2352 RepID=A0A5D0MQC4_FLESI|nr:3-phosphoshikimate 1-carboxyvinyltransferase [Flexistipes sinusarabici]TYB32939.1 MAG: 3-phosphoshikimate 1-carboxyvinyltransferase [Flexistipes sinusarabici]
MKTFKKIDSLKGEITVPPDKSVTHRAFLLSLMAEGVSYVTNPLLSRDTLSTLSAVEMLGGEVTKNENSFKIKSPGFICFKEPSNIIDCGNSGTTARLITGVLAPQGKFFVLTGDDSLKKRPMDRVIAPLSRMGAKIYGRQDNRLLPLAVTPARMFPADIKAAVKSAQVKSAVLFAAAQINGESSYMETTPTRNHSEIMLRQFGCDLTVDNNIITVKGGKKLLPSEVRVPGDFSSSAFFLSAVLMFENSEIAIKNVGLNKTRTGLLDVMKSFGVKFNVDLRNSDTGEPFGDISIKSQNVQGGKISGDIIANVIDEIPAIAALGLFAEKPVEIRDAGELRVKESDRISALVCNLRSLGADVEEFDDGLKIYPLESVNMKAELKSFGDHRIAMVNILLSKRFGNLPIDDIACVDVSFPEFLRNIEKLEVTSC